MSKTAPKIQARVWRDKNSEPVIADIVNPGGWFGKLQVIETLSGMLVIEADHEQAAIDELADSETFGHLINMDSADADTDDENQATAGNDSHPVDLDNLLFVRFFKVEYFINVPDLTDWSFVSGLQGEIEEWHAEND